MEWVFKWCGIVAIQFNSVVEVLDFAAGWGKCPKKVIVTSHMLRDTLEYVEG